MSLGRWQRESPRGGGRLHARKSGMPVSWEHQPFWRSLGLARLWPRLRSGCSSSWVIVTTSRECRSARGGSLPGCVRSCKPWSSLFSVLRLGQKTTIATTHARCNHTVGLVGVLAACQACRGRRGGGHTIVDRPPAASAIPFTSSVLRQAIVSTTPQLGSRDQPIDATGVKPNYCFLRSPSSRTIRRPIPPVPRDRSFNRN